MNPTGDPCECKVGRVIEEAGLTGMDEELAARRAGESGDPASLRALADHFNRAVLRRAVERAGRTPLEGEVANAYRLLTADDVGRGARIRVRKQLEGEGVDVDDVEDDFVSHPTMGSHLERCLGVAPAERDGTTVATARERIFKLLSRSEAVAGNTLEGLGSAGRLVAGDLAVTVDAQVMCQSCGVHRGVDAFIERGGCDCEE